MKQISADQFLKQLRARVQSAGSQTALARALDVSDAYLSDVLAGRRYPGPKITAALGYRVARTYISESA